MAWSDAARKAAVEARRRHSKAGLDGGERFSTRILTVTPHQEASLRKKANARFSRRIARTHSYGRTGLMKKR